MFTFTCPTCAYGATYPTPAAVRTAVRQSEIVADDSASVLAFLPHPCRGNVGTTLDADEPGSVWAAIRN